MMKRPVRLAFTLMFVVLVTSCVNGGHGEGIFDGEVYVDQVVSASSGNVIKTVNGMNVQLLGIKEGDELGTVFLKKYIGDSTSLILKPSVGTNSGDGVIKFNKVGEEFVSIDGKVTLTKEFLMSYGRNFCLQEAVCQHEFMNHLCATSVNTIRKIKAIC